MPIQISNQQLLLLILIASAGDIATVILMNRWKKEEPGLGQINHLLNFILFYFVILVISTTTTAYNKIANKLLSPFLCL